LKRKVCFSPILVEFFPRNYLNRGGFRGGVIGVATPHIFRFLCYYLPVKIFKNSKQPFLAENPGSTTAEYCDI